MPNQYRTVRTTQITSGATQRRCWWCTVGWVTFTIGLTSHGYHCRRHLELRAQLDFHRLHQSAYSSSGQIETTCLSHDSPQIGDVTMFLHACAHAFSTCCRLHCMWNTNVCGIECNPQHVDCQKRTWPEDLYPAVADSYLTLVQCNCSCNRDSFNRAAYTCIGASSDGSSGGRRTTPRAYIDYQKQQPWC